MSSSEVDYYQVLGVAKDASPAEITKAFRNKAKTAHPDRGGSEEAFQALNTAYEVLNDENKRRQYDLGGSDDQHGGADGMDIFDLFGGGRRRHQQARSSQEVKSKPVLYPLVLTLEEMYSGCVKKLRLTRSVCCAGCKGKGGSTITVCNGCNGKGIQTQTVRLGPGMISQTQTTCRACQGQGQMIQPGLECKECLGEKVVKEKKQIDVNVSRGGRQGQTVIFSEEGDQEPGHRPGDIIVEFQEKPHDVFQRKGFHLFYHQEISLYEALTGFTLYIPHLDGHEVCIKSTQVIKPGDSMCIPEEGMPHSFGHGKGIEVGNLYITFNVKFPTTQDINKKPTPSPAASTNNKKGNNNNNKDNEDNKSLLAKALPTTSTLRKQPASKNVTTPEVQFVDMAVEDRKLHREEQEWERYKQTQGRSSHGMGHDDDDDDHHHGGPQVAGCQPM